MSASVRKPAATPCASDAFRHTMRQLASGITVVTHGAGERRTGLTATSVASLAAEPPSLIVCVNRSTSLFAGLGLGDPFGVSVLGAEHAEIADRFAGRSGFDGAERFAAGEWISTPDGVSLLADALASVVCETEDIIERHSQAILIGRVRHAKDRVGDSALLYWRGVYDRIGWSAEEVARVSGVTPRTPRCDGTIIRFSG
jgi:flavin reductase (DIM6/NTAB) family NADH-FMN oxidoreductase RutF